MEKTSLALVNTKWGRNQRTNLFGRVNVDKLTTKEWGYLIGLFIGDGSFCIDKKSRHYKVAFSLNPIKDQDISTFITNLLKKLGLNPFKVWSNGSIDVRVNSKNLVHLLRTISADIEHYLEDDEFLIGLLSGLIDSDGSVGRRGIEVAMKNPQIFKKIQPLLKKLGVHTVLRERTQTYPAGEKIWRFGVATVFRHKRHLSKKIGRYYGSGKVYPP